MPLTSAPYGSDTDRPEATTSISWCPAWLPPGLAALLTFVTFLPTLGNDFVNWDDPFMLTDNPHFRGLGWSQLVFAWTTDWSYHYHPLTWLSYELDYVIWGMNPRGYHLTAVLIHSATAAIVVLLARTVLRRAGAREGMSLEIGALAAGLAFALHPLRVEVVAWATARRDVLAGLFFALTLLVYARAIEALESGDRRRYWRRLISALVLGVCALLSKTIAMTLPAVLLIMDVYPFRRSLRDRRLWAEKLVFAVPAGAAAVVAVVVVGRIQFAYSAGYGIVDRLAMAAYSFAFYFGKTLVPFSLSPIYEIPQRLDPTEPRFVISAVVVVAITLLAVAAWTRAPWLAAAWAFHVVTVLPVSGLTHAGFQLAYDRYAYLPGIAWAVVLGAGATAVVRAGQTHRIPRRATVALGLAALVVLGAWAHLSQRQIRVWHDTYALWTQGLLVDPSCAVCHHGFGLVARAVGHYAEAEREFREAVRIRPQFVMAQLSLAEMVAHLGRIDEALAILDEAARVFSDHPETAADFARVRAEAMRRARAQGIPLGRP